MEVFKISRIIIEQADGYFVFSNDFIRIKYNVKNGLADFYCNNKAIATGVFSTAKLANNKLIKNTDYEIHYVEKSTIESIKDNFGMGVRIAIANKSSEETTMWQNYYIYEDKPYFFVEEELEGDTEISSNYIAPICLDSDLYKNTTVEIGESIDTRFLSVPFDNDKWVRYEANPIKTSRESYEVTAIFDNISRNGLIIGSVTHDIWKTGINVEANSNNKITKLNVYAGATGELTRDTLPHGRVSAKKIKSSKIFLGLYDDYRNGLEEFGRANIAIVAPLKWEGNVPFGWNSWAAKGDKINYDTYIATSDFIKNDLKNYKSKDNTVYLNFDSFWNNLSEDQIVEAVKHVHNNNQKAGIYFSPFAYFSTDFERSVEGTDYKFRYKQILLKDINGTILPEIDGGFPIDATHSGTLMRIDWQMNRFIKWGFDFVKLDFMAHGTLEGEHYNENITTGIQAYNYGMKYIKDILDPVKMGRPFFISVSIAPLFPYQYAHSRRISCDAFGSIDQTEYMLNSLTYGWWMNNTIYKYNDPDHIVLYKSYNSNPTNEFEAQSRLNAAVIAGTVMLNSDDFNLPEAKDRAKKLLNNQAINELAQKGISFVPSEGDTGSKATDTFMLTDEGSTYLAIFNYNSDKSEKKKIDFNRLGLSHIKKYRLYDLWDKKYIIIEDINNVNVQLYPCESKIFKVEEINAEKMEKE